MGYQPRAEWTAVRSPIPQVTLHLDQIREARDKARAAMIKAQQGWERRKRTAPVFQEGDQVWLDGRNIKMYHPAAKLAPKRHGPFLVIRVLLPLTYELRLPVQWKLHPVFHIDLLTPYRETDFHGANYDKPPPDLIDGEEEYEVERIVASRRFGRGRKLQYLVKWKGYPDVENQWVAKADVFAEGAIREFHNSNSEQGVHIRRAQVSADPHSPSACPLRGQLKSPSLKSSSTSTPESLVVTSNSATSTTSPTNMVGNTPTSVDSAGACTTTNPTSFMIIPAHDPLGCEEGARYGISWPVGTRVSTPDDLTEEEAGRLGVAWPLEPRSRTGSTQVAITTDGTPITREELNAVMQRFPTPVQEALGSPEPERYNLLHASTGAVCNSDPLTRAEVDQLRSALPRGSGSSSPRPLPVRPRLWAAADMARDSSKVEGQAAGSGPGGAGGAMEARSRVEELTVACDGGRDPGQDVLFPAEHPFIRLEPADRPDDTPHVCATDGTPLYKGTVHSALLHAYQHPSAPRRRTRPDQPPPGFVRNRGSHYTPFVTTHDNVTRQVDFVQHILTSDPLVIGLRLDTDFVFAKPLHATPEYLFSNRPIYILEDLAVLDGDPRGVTNCDFLSWPNQVQGSMHRRGQSCSVHGT